MSDTDKKTSVRASDDENQNAEGFMKNNMMSIIISGIAVIAALILWLFTSIIYDCSIYLEYWLWIPLIIVLIVPFITIFFLKKQLAQIVSICLAITAIILCAILFYRRNKVTYINANGKSAKDLLKKTEDAITPSGVAVIVYNGSAPDIGSLKKYLINLGGGSNGGGSNGNYQIGKGATPNSPPSGQGPNNPATVTSDTADPSGSSTAAPPSSTDPGSSGNPASTPSSGTSASSAPGSTSTSAPTQIKNSLGGSKNINVSASGDVKANTLKDLKSVRLSGRVRQGVILVQISEKIKDDSSSKSSGSGNPSSGSAADPSAGTNAGSDGSDDGNNNQ